MARYSRFNWTGSDYDAIRADLVDKIAAAFPEWTDASPANPGMVLVELMAYVGDLVRYYQDRQVLEALLPTAVERANVVRHLQAIGYALGTASAASADVVFTLAAAPVAAVTIEQGDRFTTEDGTVTFEADARYEIAAGATSVAGTVVQGETVTEDIGASDGSAGQRYTLGQYPFLWDSETVLVDGVTWTRVDSLLDATAGAQVYRVEVYPTGDTAQEDQAVLVFGDGTNGAIPGTGAQLTASYRIGGGRAGNVDAGTITRVDKSYIDAAGNPVRLSVTNPAAASGGAERETVLHGKVYGPRALATGSRSVSAADFRTNAERVAGVARALALTVEDDATLPENTVALYVVPDGSGTPSRALLSAVEYAVTTTYPKPATTRLLVLPAVYVDVALVGTCYVERDAAGLAPSFARLQDVADAIEVALIGTDDSRGYFHAGGINPDTLRHWIDFGQRVALSKLYDLVQSVDGVARVTLTSPTGDAVLGARYFPRLRAYARSEDPTVPEVRLTWTGLNTYLRIIGEP